jgi:hypothetical protein
MIELTIPGNACPHCGEPFEVAHLLGGRDRAPKPGEYTACGACGAWSIVGDDGRSRLLTTDEADELRAIAGGFALAMAEVVVEDYRRMRGM